MLSHQQRQLLDTLSGYLRKRGMIGEGMLWKSVRAKRTSQKGELDSFTEIVNEILWISVSI